MGNSGRVWWIVVECACRILGISTATGAFWTDCKALIKSPSLVVTSVENYESSDFKSKQLQTLNINSETCACISAALSLCIQLVLFGVGVETVQHKEFNSLGIYLIASSVGILMFELAYFLDALLSMCLLCPPDWELFVLWRKMAHIGGFHKFLFYTIMSVICFLHPILVWHAIIPGSMLLVTAFFNFILSKKTKSPKSPQDTRTDHNPTTVCVTERSASDSSVSFFQGVTGRREEALSGRDHSLDSGETGESVQAMLKQVLTQSPKVTGGERRRWKERRLKWFRGRQEPVEREMEEMDGCCDPEPDTTSDTARMIAD